MDLGTDERAQAMQVGFIILFAFLLILFATYQAVIVPNQNKAVEFNHNQQVQGDMVTVRNAILQSKSTGEDQYAEVELGTQYPARLIAINPAPPSGTLQTNESRPIVVEENDTGTEITGEVCPGSDFSTRPLEYTPSYSAYQGEGTLKYENSLLYHQFDDGTVLLTGQDLVQGDTLQLIPLQSSYSESGSGTVSIEPKAGLLDTSTRSDIDVTLPTQLSESKWEEALSGQVDPENVTVTRGADGRNVTLYLGGEYTISCGPVGLDEAPPSGARGEEGDEINPAGPGSIILEGESFTNDNVTLTFNNTGGTNNFTKGRINFYQPQSGGGGVQKSYGDVLLPNGSTQRLQIGGDWETLDPNIELRGGGTVTNVYVEFDKNVKTKEWFVISFELESGETAIYFVSLA